MSKVNKDLIFLNQNSKLTPKVSRENTRISTSKSTRLDQKEWKQNLLGNPNVDRLVQDFRVKPSLANLQNDLKKEFEDFLSLSVNDSIQKFKPTNTDNQDSDSFFLTQIESPSKIEFPNYEQNVTIEKTNDKPKTPNENKKNFQIALIPTHKETKRYNSLIQLKNIIQDLKVNDLPEFQAEFHQLCQFDDDSKFLKNLKIESESKLVEKKNGLGRCGIHECCIRGNTNLLTTLISYLNDINMQDNNGCTAAHIAAKFGQVECLKILYDHGIDLYLQDRNGKNLTHYAAEFNHPNVIEFCMELEIPLNTRCKSGKLPIHYASEFGCVDALKKLVTIDLSVRDGGENTAAHLAVRNDHLNCLKFLVKLGLPLNNTKNKQGRNVPHEACYFGAINCLHWMFESGLVDISSLDDSNNSLAHSCCAGGQAECLNCCIQHNVDICGLNSNWQTPLEIARKIGKGLYLERAIKNEITCSQCVENALRLKMEKENEKTIPEQIIEKNYDKMYCKNRQISHRSNENFRIINKSASRDLVAQYFGPEI